MPAPAALPGASERAHPFEVMRRVFKLVGVVFVAGALAAAGGAWWLQSQVGVPFRGFDGDEAFVEISQGLGVNAIAARLASACVVRDPWTFRLAVWREGAGRSLKAGEYRFAEAATPLAVVERLARGDVYLRTITFPEGWSIRDMAAAFESRGFGEARAFAAAASDQSRVADLDRAASDLEGYLFPDMYAMPRRASAQDLAGPMVARFRSVVGDEMLARAAKQPGGVRATLTLASLVEKETSKADEWPVVAGVYRNRLRIGMGLQCDPTVIYALARDGKVHRQHPQGRPAVRLAVQHLSYARPSARADRLRRGAPRLRPRSRRPNPFPLLRQPQRRLTRVRDHPGEHNRNVYMYQVLYFREKRARARAEQLAQGR